MQKKSIMMILAAGLAVGMLTGCGVPEEEHLAALAEKDAKYDANDKKLNTKIADQETLIKSEQAKVRTQLMELDESSARIKKLQQEKADAIKATAAEKTKVADLESDLKTSQSKAAAAQELADENEGKYNTLKVEFEELERRFENFKRNMNAMSGAAEPAAAEAVTDIPGAVMAEDVPQTDAQKVDSLLEQMGNM